MEYKNILLIEAPGVKLKTNGLNLGAVRRQHPKISQLTLAAIVQREFPASEVEIQDLKLGNKEKQVNSLTYGNKQIEVYQIGRDFSEIDSNIRHAELILLTANFTQEAGIIGDLIEFCKTTNPRAKIFMGGSDTSIRRDEVNRADYFYRRGADLVAPLGDGEIILPRLINGGKVLTRTIAPNLDTVPNLAFNLVDVKQYIESHEGPLPEGIKTPLMYLETSRGCKQSCDFCGTPFVKGKYRYMSQKRIEDFLLDYKKAGITTLLLCEDNVLSRLDFPDGRKDVLKWFRFMREQGFAWEFSNGIEIGKLAQNGNLDEEIIEELFGFDGRNGCYRAYLPFERVDRVAYKKLKPFDTEKKIFRIIIQQKVPLFNLGIIIGNPEETMESLNLTEQRVKELMESVKDFSNGESSAYANIFLHIPIPGTNDYRRFFRERRLEFDINKHPELFNFYTSVVNGDHFSCYDLTEIRREMALRLNGEQATRLWESEGKYSYSL